MCSVFNGACSDSATDKPLGTGCDGGFCNGSGACTSCQLGAACGTNPGAPCRKGAFARKTATCSCEDAIAVGDGTVCPGGYCGSGLCVACVNGSSCSMNPCQAATRQFVGGVCCCKLGAIAANGTLCPLGACAAGTCCTGCIQSANPDTCSPGIDLGSCGLGGSSCVNCGSSTFYGACLYAGPCSLTGDRDILSPICNRQGGCDLIKTGTDVAPAACNRATDGVVCSNGCGPFQCGLVCAAGSCSVVCGGGC